MSEAVEALLTVNDASEALSEGETQKTAPDLSKVDNSSDEDSQPGPGEDFVPDRGKVEQKEVSAEQSVESSEPATAEGEGSDSGQKTVVKRSPVTDQTELKLPTGYTLTQDGVDSLIDQAKAHDLSEEDLQAFVEFDAVRLKQQAEATVAKARKTQEEWISEMKRDPEIGGQNFDQTIVDAKKVVQRFGSDAFVKLLETTQLDGPLGSHPEMIRLLSSIGKGRLEDTVAGNDSQFGGRSGRDPRRLVPEWN